MSVSPKPKFEAGRAAGGPLNRRALCGAVFLFFVGVNQAAVAQATSSSDSPTMPARISVEASGVLPGFNSAELLSYLAGQMNAAHAGPWRFETPAIAAEPPLDRVAWSFKSIPQAAGAIRNYGFSQAMMDRLVGSSHRAVAIEARLYRHGAYQALVSGQAALASSPPDPELASLVFTLTRELMAASQMGDATAPK